MPNRINIPTTLVAGLLLLFTIHPVTAQEENHNHGDAHEHASETHRSSKSAESEESPYDIHFETHPEPGQIVPDGEKVELLFEVHHGEEIANNVELSYRVHSPEENVWFGTEFPVVEGTPLLSGTVALPDGNQVMSMILPIRGTYQIMATARGPKGTTTQEFQFTVPGNPQEVVNLSVFLLVLFILGGVGGWIVSRAKPGNVPGSWLFAIALTGAIFALANPTAVHAHGDGNWDPHNLEDQLGEHTILDDAHLDAKLFPQPVSVGDMLNVRYHAEVHGTDHGESDILAESHFVHSAGGLEMANQTHWLKNGRGEINLQLFDGAPHYLVTRFYRPVEGYSPAGIHDHDDGGHDDHAEEHDGDQADEAGHDGEQDKNQSNTNDGHDHGSDSSFPWEAELALQLESGDYTVRFHESGDPAMKWLLLPSADDNRREKARHAMENCQSIDRESTIPGDTSCHDLTLNPDGTTFTLRVPEGGSYRLFTEHLPREFDMTIEDDNGSVVEPNRTFVTGKGEQIGRLVKWIDVSPVQPPFGAIVKSMVTLLFVTGLGVFVGYKGPEWLG